MRTTIYRLAVLFAVALLFSGCTGSADNFTDDFSDPASGWVGGSYADYARGYVNGEYVFQIFVPETLVWSTPGKQYRDVTIETMTRTEGNTDNHYGLICRVNGGEFYYFAVSSDGYYGIYHRDADGNLISLTGDTMLHSTEIRGNAQQNRLTVSCIESTLSLYVNGQQLAEVEDETLTKGDIGLAAGTVSSTGTNVWFDNITVSTP